MENVIEILQGKRPIFVDFDDHQTYKKIRLMLIQTEDIHQFQFEREVEGEWVPDALEASVRRFRLKEKIKKAYLEYNKLVPFLNFNTTHLGRIFKN